jgi:hypothetical protein
MELAGYGVQTIVPAEVRVTYMLGEGIWTRPVGESKISKWGNETGTMAHTQHEDFAQWLSQVDPRLDPSIMLCKEDQKETENYYENYYVYCTYD